MGTSDELNQENSRIEGELNQPPPVFEGPGAEEHDASPPRGLPFPVVGIGASAGGLDAITQLLRALPANCGMAFVIVQHLDPHHESQLTELLAGTTDMPVRSVVDGMVVSPNVVYVLPPNADIRLQGNQLKLLRRR